MAELVANFDSYREVINGEKTYSWISKQLKKHGVCLIGWTDEAGTHCDILFTQSHAGAPKIGTIAGGIRNTDLFVSIMRFGAWGFEKNLLQVAGGYIAEKFGIPDGETADKIAELIGGVRIRL